MAENDDFESPFPAPDEPGGPPGGQGGDLPADFFDDVDEPSPVAINPLPAGEIMAATDRVTPGPTPPPRPISPPVEPKEPKGSPFPVVLGGLMLATLVGGVLASRQTDKAAETAGPPTSASPAATPPPPAPTDATATRVKELQEQFEGMGKQLKDLQAKVEGMPKSESAPDLKPIEMKIDGLTKNVEGLAALPEKLGKLDERFGGIDEALKAVRGDVSGLKEEVKKVGDGVAKAESPKPAPAVAAVETRPAATGPIDAAVSRGAEFFKAGKYQEAAAAFKKIEASNPKDARVYYFAALSTGLTTNVWNGETEKLVLKGVELEKAGTPAAIAIDTALTGVPPQLKTWLDAYRARAR